jgi:hypothetical protein
LVWVSVCPLYSLLAPDELTFSTAMPSISRSRDQGELQDMYRRALAASWAAAAGELPADQCVEDIFNGGDGWNSSSLKGSSAPRLGVSAHFEDDLNNEHHDRHHHHRTASGSSTKSAHSQSTVTTKRTVPRKGHGHKHKDSNETMGISPGLQSDSLSEVISERGRTGFRRAHEVDEFDVREDLVAWKLPNNVY